MTRIAFQMAWIDLLVFIMISPRNNLKAYLQSYCAFSNDEECYRLTPASAAGHSEVQASEYHKRLCEVLTSELCHRCPVRLQADVRSKTDIWLNI